MTGNIVKLQISSAQAKIETIAETIMQGLYFRSGPFSGSGVEEILTRHPAPSPNRLKLNIINIVSHSSFLFVHLCSLLTYDS